MSPGSPRPGCHGLFPPAEVASRLPQTLLVRIGLSNFEVRCDYLAAKTVTVYLLDVFFGIYCFAIRSFRECGPLRSKKVRKCQVSLMCVKKFGVKRIGLHSVL